MVENTELLVTQESDYAIAAFLKRKATDNRTEWKIITAPGVDPVLVMCIAAIVEDTTSFSALRDERRNAQSITNLTARTQ
jgi:hypothetical protein